MILKHCGAERNGLGFWARLRGAIRMQASNSVWAWIGCIYGMSVAYFIFGASCYGH